MLKVRPPSSIQKQQGIVLVIALLLLMVMTVIGSSMLSTATLEERMASNMQQQYTTLQATDSCTNAIFQQTAIINNSIISPNVIQPNMIDAGTGNLIADPYDCVVNDNLTNVDSAGGTAIYSSATGASNCNGGEIGMFECLDVTLSVGAQLDAAGASTAIQQVISKIVPTI